MIAQFALRLVSGISLTWLMLPRSQITSGFFRIQSLLALALGALGGITLGAAVFGLGQAPLLPASFLRGGCFVAAGLAYVSSVLWTLGRRRGGTVCLIAIAAISTGTLLAGSLSRESLTSGLSFLTAFSELATSLTIGGATVGMLLGHWYLNTPTASGKPLEFVTILLVAGLLTELIFALLIGPSTAQHLPGAVTLVPGTTIHASGTGVVVTTPTPLHTPTGQPSTTASQKVAPIDTSAMVWLQFTMGIISPLILGVVALWLTRGRSFQSATGMLYLCMAFIFIGEILARGLMLLPVL